MIPIRSICLIVICIASFGDALGADRSFDLQREFLRSLDLFDSAKTADDFKASARVLEDLVAEGVCSGAIYYNLGNAYYRAGEFGRAILNYRKAKFYRPQDPLLDANLQQAILSAPGKLVEPTQPWWKHVMFWTEWLSYPTRAKLAIAFFAFAPVLALMAILLRSRGLLYAVVGISLIGLLFGLDATFHSPVRITASRAVITAETIARKGIGKDYEAAFDSPLKDGAEFDVLQETNGWTFGHFEGVGDGWIRNEFIAR